MTIHVSSEDLHYLNEHQQMQKEERMSCPNQMLEKTIQNPLLFEAPYLSHFLSILSNLKTCGVHQLKLYKTSLTLKAMKQYSKILSSKSQVILTHPSSNIDLLYFRTHLLFFFLFFWAIFTIMSASNEGLQYLLELQRKPPKNNSKTLSVQP